MSDSTAVLPHVVVVTIGTAGDLFPYLSLALGLRARGHPVTVLAPHIHEAFVRRVGLPFHSLPGDVAVFDDPDLWHPRRGFGVVWRSMRPAMQAMRAFVAALPSTQPCTLLVHPLAVAYADLCRFERPDLALVTAFLAPSNLRTVHDLLTLGPMAVAPWVPLAVRRWLWKVVEATAINPAVLPELNAARRVQGRAPISSLMDTMYGAPDLAITLFPAWFGPSQPDWPTPLVCGDFPLYDPHAGAAMAPALAQFVRAGSAPIVVTHGSGNRQAAAFFVNVLSAVQRMGRRVVFLTPHRGQIPAVLPECAFWQDYCPLATLLPAAAALVHHGGIGTTAEALRAGTPQLVVPLAYDQFDNGARVAALHAGLSLKASRATVRNVVESLEKLLQSPEVYVGCSEAKLRVATGEGLALAVESISKSVSKTRKI